MDTRSPLRLRRKPPAPRSNVRKFKPRMLPRDKYDLRLLIGLYAVLTPVILLAALAWMLIPTLVAVALGLGALSSIVFFIQWVLWMLGLGRVLISHVETDDNGLRVVSAKTNTIAWGDIESVEPLNRGEAVRAMLRWPYPDWNLKSSGGQTLGGYVRIRHKNGILLFGPENRAAFLSELHTHLYRTKSKVEIPVWQWHEAYVTEVKKDVDNVQHVGRRTS